MLSFLHSNLNFPKSPSPTITVSSHSGEWAVSKGVVQNKINMCYAVYIIKLII